MLRDFLKNMAYACTEDEILAARIGLSAVLDFDHEMKEADCCAFSMKKVDFTNGKNRMKHLFAWKYLPEIDIKKAERCEDLVILLSLYHYKNKYKTEQFNTEIETLTASIEENPVPEVDAEMPLELTTQGLWAD